MCLMVSNTQFAFIFFCYNRCKLQRKQWAPCIETSQSKMVKFVFVCFGTGYVEKPSAMQWTNLLLFCNLFIDFVNNSLCSAKIVLPKQFKYCSNFLTFHPKPNEICWKFSWSKQQVLDLSTNILDRYFQCQPIQFLHYSIRSVYYLLRSFLVIDIKFQHAIWSVSRGDSLD